MYFTFLEIYIFFLKNDWNRKTFFINTVFLWEITKNRIVPRSFSRNWRIIKDRNEPKHCLQNAIWNMQKMQYETQFAVWKWCLCFLVLFFFFVHLFLFVDIVCFVLFLLIFIFPMRRLLLSSLLISLYLIHMLVIFLRW